jgi:hypothetical protein
MKIQSLICIFSLSLIFLSCKDNKEKNEPQVVTVETTPETKEYTLAGTEAEFNDPKVKVIFEDYIQLETALVNTNSEKTAVAAKSLFAKLVAIDAGEEITKTVESIAGTTDIELQREAFVDVTAYMEGLLVGSVKSGAIYKQYCPMAFGNTGAYWLSSSKDILNPYFGDKMLKCGRVAAEIK